MKGHGSGVTLASSPPRFAFCRTRLPWLPWHRFLSADCTITSVATARTARTARRQWDALHDSWLSVAARRVLPRWSGRPRDRSGMADRSSRRSPQAGLTKRCGRRCSRRATALLPWSVTAQVLPATRTPARSRGSSARTPSGSWPLSDVRRSWRTLPSGLPPRWRGDCQPPVSRRRTRSDRDPSPRGSGDMCGAQIRCPEAETSLGPCGASRRKPQALRKRTALSLSRGLDTLPRLTRWRATSVVQPAPDPPSSRDRVPDLHGDRVAGRPPGAGATPPPHPRASSLQSSPTTPTASTASTDLHSQ